MQRLASPVIDPHVQVAISTTHSMYSVPSGERIDESPDDTSLNEVQQRAAQAKFVRYSAAVPIEPRPKPARLVQKINAESWRGSLNNLAGLPPPDVPLQQEAINQLEAALTAFRDALQTCRNPRPSKPISAVSQR